MSVSTRIADSVRDFCGLTSDFNTEINELIDQCKAELRRVGVLAENISDTDPLIITAAKLYSAWMRDINGKGEAYKFAFEGVRNALAMDEEYINVQSED